MASGVPETRSDVYVACRAREPYLSDVRKAAHEVDVRVQQASTQPESRRQHELLLVQFRQNSPVLGHDSRDGRRGDIDDLDNRRLDSVIKPLMSRWWRDTIRARYVVEQHTR